MQTSWILEILPYIKADVDENNASDTNLLQYIDATTTRMWFHTGDG